MEGRALREDDGGRSGVRSAVQGRYRGLVVDFGGVLSTSFDGALRSFCVREGLAPDALSRVFSLDAGAKGLLVDLERGAIGQDQFVAHLAPALGVCPDGLLERIVADLRPEPLVTAAVQELRRQGIPVVISHQVGLRKPDPQIFALAADRIAVPPSECVFVDDVERYLPPARALGMAVIHATDPTTTVTELSRHFRRP
jgi:putative hydrolase of the HAD superfamily